MRGRGWSSQLPVASSHAADHESCRVRAPGLQTGVPSCQFSDARATGVLCICYAGGVEAGSPGSRSAPRETAEGIINPGGVAAGRGDLRTAFGVRAPPHARPRVGAVAPTRGYRLQRLRRRGGRVGQGMRRVRAPGLHREFEVPRSQFPEAPTVGRVPSRGASWTSPGGGTRPSIWVLVTGNSAFTSFRAAIVRGGRGGP